MIVQVCGRCGDRFCTETSVSQVRCWHCLRVEGAQMGRNVERLLNEAFPKGLSSDRDTRPRLLVRNLTTRGATVLDRLVVAAKGMAGASSWMGGFRKDPCERVFLSRTARLAAIRSTGTLEPWQRLLVDHALYSTYWDLVGLGLRSEARQIRGSAPELVGRVAAPGSPPKGDLA